MTVYVDDFIEISASADRDGRRWSLMLADTDAELRKFAGHLRQGRTDHRKHHVAVDREARRNAVLLGAVEVTYQQLAAMNALRLLGEEMGEPATARDRRNEIARRLINNGKLRQVRRVNFSF